MRWKSSFLLCNYSFHSLFTVFICSHLDSCKNCSIAWGFSRSEIISSLKNCTTKSFDWMKSTFRMKRKIELKLCALARHEWSWQLVKQLTTNADDVHQHKRKAIFSIWFGSQLSVACQTYSKCHTLLHPFLFNFSCSMNSLNRSTRYRANPSFASKFHLDFCCCWCKQKHALSQTSVDTCCNHIPQFVSIEENELPRTIHVITGRLFWSKICIYILKQIVIACWSLALYFTSFIAAMKTDIEGKIRNCNDVTK